MIAHIKDVQVFNNIFNNKTFNRKYVLQRLKKEIICYVIQLSTKKRKNKIIYKYFR